MKKNIYILFGGTGDLSLRYLLPSIEELAQHGKNIETIIVGRSIPTTDTEKEAFFGKIHTPITNKESFHFVRVDATKSDDYIALGEVISRVCGDCEENVVFYLSVAPFLFPIVVENLKKNNLHVSQNGTRKIAIEKPFGHDLASAKELNITVADAFDEEHIYRVDHYLGKHAVQNILSFRFENSIFEALWNNAYVEKVEIVAYESLGTDGRAGYYDTSGALRDMVQNHLLQVLSLIAMDRPKCFDPECIRDEKAKVLDHMNNLQDDFSEHVIFGQYKGYLEEEGVQEHSRTETYAALKFFIENDRWKGVPFYIKTGKNLAKKETKVVLTFKHSESQSTNTLTLVIHPHAAIKMELQGYGSSESLEAQSKPTYKVSYAKLIEDMFDGDQTLFVRWDSIKLSWEIIDSLVNCRDNCPLIHTYEPGVSEPEVVNHL